MGFHKLNTKMSQSPKDTTPNVVHIFYSKKYACLIPSLWNGWRSLFLFSFSQLWEWAGKMLVRISGI